MSANGLSSRGFHHVVSVAQGEREPKVQRLVEERPVGPDPLHSTTRQGVHSNVAKLPRTERVPANDVCGGYAVLQSRQDAWCNSKKLCNTNDAHT
jgi:hypothetical protein